MCVRVNCQKCGKPTFSGCGRHIEAVLGDVPREQRCACVEQEEAKGPISENATKGLFRRLFG